MDFRGRPRDLASGLLLRQLGLGLYVSVSQDLEERSARSGHLFLLLRSATGGPMLLLKERKDYLSREEFRLHIALHRHLLERGGPVVEIPPTLASRLPLELPDGRLVEIQEWNPGRSPSPESEDDQSRMGRTLAAFHRAAADFPWPSDNRVHREPRERFAKARFYRGFLEGALAGQAGTLVDALYQRLEEAARSWAAVEARRGPVALQALHGDPAPSNLLLSGDGGGVLIDLDDAHRGPCVADIAWLLCLTAGLRPVASTPSRWQVRDRWDHEIITAVLSGYASGGGASAALDPEGLRPWLVASMVCALGDCFLGGSHPVGGREVFCQQLELGLELIARIPTLELAIVERTLKTMTTPTRVPALHREFLPGTIQHAATLPFYRDRWQGIDLEGIRLPTDLHRLPVMTKADVEDFLESYDYGDQPPASVSHSSGTTGNVTMRCKSAEELQFLFDFYSRLLPKTEGDRPLTLAVHSANHGSPVRLPAEGLVLRAHGMGPSVVDHVIQMLERRHRFPGVTERVQKIFCVLGFLQLLTVELVRRGVRISELGVREITVTGDYLSSHWRAQLERHWQARIHNNYSLSEIFGGATECHSCGAFSFHPQTVVEIVDPWTREPLEQGVGLLVMTELYPYSQMQPLVRYLGGDLVESHPLTCDGTPGPVFRFLGRWQDVVIDPEHRSLLLFPAEVTSLLDPLPELARSDQFEEVPLDAWNRDLGPVLGEIHTEREGSVTRIRLRLAPRFSPAVFPEAAETLRETIHARLLDGCTGLRAQVDSGKVRLSVELTVAEEITNVLRPN